ncbi:MAG: hypothetical protein GIW99_07505 [Candidatus Eremiobacteraeota bacterium]|nr:hypothetical protein [Candidatus Eremiobacteraeota bacterium]MBC5827509.1 hypothetical protein [Candidatus Eremiobacteraeota bacterium]
MDEKVNLLEREIVRLRVCILALMLLLPLALVGAGTREWQNASFNQITVRRLNLVDENGALRLAISNAQNFPPPMMHGKPFGVGMRSGGGSPSFVFYNADGDEQGGFRWGGGGSSGGKFDQFMSLSEDQFRQNDDLMLSFNDSNEDRTAGLTGDEQPDTTPLDLLTHQLNTAVLAGKTDAEKAAIRQQFVNEHFTGRHQFFVGYNPGGSMLKLYDKTGHLRILLAVDAKTGEPTLEFLDATGNVTSHQGPILR